MRSVEETPRERTVLNVVGYLALTAAVALMLCAIGAVAGGWTHLRPWLGGAAAAAALIAVLLLGPGLRASGARAVEARRSAASRRRDHGDLDDPR